MDYFSSRRKISAWVFKNWHYQELKNIVFKYKNHSCKNSEKFEFISYQILHRFYSEKMDVCKVLLEKIIHKYFLKTQFDLCIMY